MLWKTSISAVILSFLLSCHSLAQAPTGTILGNVRDASGAVVPGATVKIINTLTNQTRELVTDENGNYSAPYLPIGVYAVAIELSGFKSYRMENINLQVDQKVRVDAVLEVGEVSETVTVTGTILSLQTESPTVGTVIDNSKVVQLPLNGRTFVQLALLVPGVNPGTPGSITVRRNRGAVGSQLAMSANGFRDTQNRFYYDGIEAQDLDSYNFSFAPSIDAIQEFKVQTSTYSAEVGGAPGGHINLTTKSGTNAFHGGAWEFNRNDALTARNAFQPVGAKPPRLNRNQFGANIGGPIRKDKSFFFFNWESGRQVFGISNPIALVPPVPFRNGDFSSLLPNVVILDPRTGQPFPNNVIPPERISRAARVFLEFVPLPNTFEQGGAINFRGQARSAPITQDQYVVRVDHNFSPKDALAASYVFNDQADENVTTFGFDNRGNLARSQNASIAETHVFGPRAVNEIRIGWHRFFEHEFFGSTGKPEFDVAGKMGIPGVSRDPRNFGTPTISYGFSAPQTRGIGPRDRLNQLWQFGDSLSLTLGRHFLKLGATVSRRNWTFDESVDPRGTFIFSGVVTAGSAPPRREHQFADFLLGLATFAQVSAEPFSTRLNNFWHAYYIQDDWKVTPNFTLNLGLRYEYFQPPKQRGDEINNFELDGFGFVVKRQIFTTTPGFSRALVFPDRNNFGPRLGFAYRLPWSKETVLRGGYGIYYNPEITNSYTVLTLNPPIVKTFTFTGTARDPIQIETAFQGPGQTRVGLFGAFGLDPNLRDTYSQQWNLTLQHRFPKDVFVDIGYVGSKGTNLTLSFDANRPLEVGDPRLLPPISQRRPLQGFDRVSVTKSIGNSTYHSMQLKVERRVAVGLTLLGSYTFSKSLSGADISSVGGGFFNGGIQDIYNQRADKSPSAFDIRHRLSVTFLYDLPALEGAHALARNLFGGWQIGAIITEQTGFASLIGGTFDSTGTGITSRADQVLGQKPMLPRSQRSAARWFNTAAFAPPPFGRFGTATRNPIHLPGLNQVDFAAVKQWTIKENHRLQFRAEFFNFFNHVNLGAPNLSPLSPDFGRITSTSQGAGAEFEPRIIQFGLKYSF